MRSCFAEADWSRIFHGLSADSIFVFLQLGFFKRNLKEKMEAVEASNEIPKQDSEQPVPKEEAGDPGCLEPLQEGEAQDEAVKD